MNKNKTFTANRFTVIYTVEVTDGDSPDGPDWIYGEDGMTLSRAQLLGLLGGLVFDSPDIRRIDNGCEFTRPHQLPNGDWSTINHVVVWWALEDTDDTE